MGVQGDWSSWQVKGRALAGRWGSAPQARRSRASETHRKIKRGQANTEIVKIPIRPSHGWRKKLRLKMRKPRISDISNFYNRLAKITEKESARKLSADKVMRCVIISAGNIEDFELMKKYISPGDYVIAADGGLRYFERLGVKPDCVLGDFDSLGYIPDNADKVFPSQKDDTDTMLAIKQGLAKGFGEFVILGGLGGRLDHTLANISALEYLRIHGAKGMLVDESTVVRLFGVGDEIKPIMSGTENYFSVFPYGCEYAVVSMSGVEYPTARQKINCSFPLGVSNHITDRGNFSMTVHEGRTIVIECKEG